MPFAARSIKIDSLPICNSRGGASRRVGSFGLHATIFRCTSCDATMHPFQLRFVLPTIDVVRRRIRVKYAIGVMA
jgi:hypothetical protein